MPLQEQGNLHVSKEGVPNIYTLIYGTIRRRVYAQNEFHMFYYVTRQAVSRKQCLCPPINMCDRGCYKTQEVHRPTSSGVTKETFIAYMSLQEVMLLQIVHANTCDTFKHGTDIP